MGGGDVANPADVTLSNGCVMTLWCDEDWPPVTVFVVLPLWSDCTIECKLPLPDAGWEREGPCREGEAAVRWSLASVRETVAATVTHNRTGYDILVPARRVFWWPGEQHAFLCDSTVLYYMPLDVVSVTVRQTMQFLSSGHRYLHPFSRMDETSETSHIMCTLMYDCCIDEIWHRVSVDVFRRCIDVLQLNQTHRHLERTGHRSC